MDCAAKFYRNKGNLPLLDLLQGGTGEVLDCGCGAGDNARLLKERGWKTYASAKHLGSMALRSFWPVLKADDPGEK